MIGLVGMAFVFLFSACSDLGFLHEVYLFSNLDIDIGFCGLFVSLPLQGNDTRMFFFFFSLWFLLFYPHLYNCAVHKFHFCFPFWYVFSVNVVILLFCHMKISHSVPLFSLIEIA